MVFRDRVRARVEALGASPITLARSVGLERGFINDILIGRKTSVRTDKIPLVARALNCDPRYLTGEIDQPTPEENVWSSHNSGMPVAGICETGAWRRPIAMPKAQTIVPIEPDSRYRGAAQQCFEVRGDAMAPMRVLDGMYVITVDYQHFVERVRPLASGMLVVLRRERVELGEVELSVRTVDQRARRVLLRGSLDGAASEDIDTSAPPAGEELSIVGVVTRAVRIFT